MAGIYLLLIYFNTFSYTLYALTFFSNNHYTCKIRVNGSWLEYDGLQERNYPGTGLIPYTSATEQIYESRLGLSGRDGSHVLVVLNGFGWSLDEFLKW